MLKITESYINSLAPNESAIANCLVLLQNNSFEALYITSDETVIFGECLGSGANSYLVSIDFIKPENPVFRCTCPSRQFPCKHALGLLFAYIDGYDFKTAEIPQDIINKRKKGEIKKERQRQGEKMPRKINRSAALKKIKAQMEGLELLEKITCNMAQAGLGTISPKTLNDLEDQARQLGNYYIPGAQSALRELILLFRKNEEREEIYTAAVDCLARLYYLCRKGRELLNKKLSDAGQTVDESSALEEYMGRVWQLAELRELGMLHNNVELVQLFFNSYTDMARQEYVDEGLWLNLKTGQIQKAVNYRPYRAAGHMRADDSFFDVALVPELFVYPGGLNPRIRWEGMTLRVLKAEDYAAVQAFAESSFSESVKKVKNQIKNPLADKHPAVLLKYSRLGAVGGLYVIEDTTGQRLVLEDRPAGNAPSGIRTIQLMAPADLQRQAVLVRFRHDLDSGKLRVQPLSIITGSKIIRLVY